MRLIRRATALSAMVLALSALAADPVAPNKDALERQIKKITAAIPSSWKVRVDGSTVWIERGVAAEMMINAANVGPGMRPELKHPTLVIYCSSAVTRAKLDELNKRMAARAKAIEMLEASMKEIPNNAMPMGEQGGYRAETPDQQARIDAYVTVKKALPEEEAPTMFAADAAFYWGNYWYTPTQDEVQKELDEVKAKIQALFDKEPLK